jgi:Ran GTPase-activating protein (RanGAP) involved in mRNA processing and transport
MPEEYIGKREFDGFATSIRSDFQRLADQWTQALSKLDTLLNGRIEEARVMGEISSDIRAIRERQERQERAVEDVKRSAEEHAESFRESIDELWVENARIKDLQIGRWWQIVMYVLAALAGGLASTFIQKVVFK